MSNVIQFLEEMGTNPALTKFSAAQYAMTVEVLNVDEAQRWALLNRDHAALNALLGGRETVRCLILPPDEGLSA